MAGACNACLIIAIYLIIYPFMTKRSAYAIVESASIIRIYGGCQGLTFETVENEEYLQKTVNVRRLTGYRKRIKINRSRRCITLSEPSKQSHFCFYRKLSKKQTRINYETRYTYSPNFSPNLYVVIMNESAVSDISKFVSSQRGLKKLSFGSV